MPLTLNDIADRLASSGLLSVGEIATLLAGLSDQRPETPQQFVQALVQRGTLTEYQAQCVLSGQTAHLVLGSYIVLDLLGQGGMGTVLKARHRHMDRVVAVKVLSPASIQTPTFVERFQREVRAAARLSHPNIVTAFDAGEHEGTHFLVMEYVQGQNLSSLVKEVGPLTVVRAVDYVLQAARGLEYAHQRGIIHRDIKPANLMLSTSRLPSDGEAALSPADGIIKILDLGLAHFGPGQIGNAQDELTTTGSVMGTVDYMSPEQTLDSKQADARSDVYSLGCTLFFLLTGRPIYPGESAMRRLLAHRDSPIPDLKALRPVITDPIQTAFSTMVAKRPPDRFQTMTHVIEAFEALRAACGTYESGEFRPKRSTVSRTERPTAVRPDADRTSAETSASPTVPLDSAQTVLSNTTHKRRFRFLVSAAVVALLVVIAVVWPRGPNQRLPAPDAKPIRLHSSESASDQPAVVIDHDRRVAEWVLQRHGFVYVDGQSDRYTAIADLPKQNFKTTDIWFEDPNSKLDDDNLKNLIGLDSLKRFTLYDNYRVTDAGIAHLKGLPSLERLDLRDTRMTDEGLKQFAALERLEFLVLIGNQFTDEGVGHLEACKHLRILGLRLPQMTDQALPKISGLLTRLAGLEIGDSQVTNAGLAHLAGLQHLELLGVDGLHISDDGLKHLLKLNNLVVLHLSRTPITDAGLIHLRALNKLTELLLNDTQVTEAGVAELRTALPKCVIQFSKPNE